MKVIFLIPALIFSLNLFSQATIVPLQDLWMVNQSERSFKLHSSIQPLNRQNDNDTVSGFDLLKGTAKSGNYLKVNVVPDSYATYEDSMYYRAAAGFSLETQLNHKFYARTSISAGWGTSDNIYQTHSFFTYNALQKESFFADVRARFSYTFNKALQVSAGVDNQFFGEGARSLIQGDQAAPNPFAMMRANFWRLEYGLLYQTFREYEPVKDVWKFSATHYLSFNATKNWNITLLENVLFRPKDSIYNRGFELEYLNPIVFFRPQEYSLGSSDNVLLAAQTSLTLGKQTVYGQVALDEFDINEIRARSKWWANKFAVQLGIKGQLKSDLRYRFEGNIIRPFTYSHINKGQNIGNYGRPLAHPNGSNLAELLAEVQLLKNKWNIKSYAVFLLKGYDFDSVSYGGDVYVNYTKRNMEYGYMIGQGKTVRSIILGTEISCLMPKIKSRIYIDPQYRYFWGETQSKSVFYINAGIRSELFGIRRRF